MKHTIPAAANRTVYEFPYFTGKINFLPVYIIRAFLACVMCGFGCLLIGQYLEMPNGSAALFMFSAGMCLNFYLLFTFLPKRYVALFTVAVCVIFAYIFRETLAEYYMCFWDKLMDIAGVKNTSFTFGTGYGRDDFAEANTAVMLIIAALNAFITAISCAGKFRPENIIVTELIFLVPAFVGESACFYPSITFFAAAFAGLCALNTAGNSALLLVAGNDKLANSEQYRRERGYAQSSRKLLGFSKMRADLAHFGQHTSSAVALFIVTAIVFTTVAAALPKNAVVDVDKIISALSDLVDRSGLNGIFNSSIESDGFFTADSGSDFINITNGVGAEGYRGGNDEAVRVTISGDVTLSGESAPVYLRADVGYAYQNESWKSISSIDYGAYFYDGNPMSDILDGYATDIDYQLMRQRAAICGYDGSQFFPLVNVKIDYTKKTNAVLMPLSPYELTFRDNTAFNCTGDFVASVKNAFSRISSYEALALVPTIDVEQFQTICDILYTSGYYDDPLYDNEGLIFPPEVYYAKYVSDTNAYKAFVDTVYTEVPPEEQANVSALLEEVEFADIYYYAQSMANYYNPTTLADIGDGCSACFDKAREEFYNYSLAYLLTSYLSSGTDYTYSLTAPNRAGDNTYLGNFLFDTKQGHCALYATTLTLLLRNSGIPARYVTGYVVDDGGAATTDGVVYSVKEKQLHAWVEVYFDHVGWLPFDPTPGSAGGTSPVTTTEPDTEITTETTTAVTTEIPGELTTTEPVITTTSSSETAPHGGTTPPSGTETDGNAEWSRFAVPAIIILVLALAALLAYSRIKHFLKELDRRECALRKRFDDDEKIAACRLMLKFLLKLFRLSGITRRNGESPLEFAARAEKERTINSIQFTEVMAVFERVEFAAEGEVEVTDAERTLCRHFVTRHITKFLAASDKPLLRLKARYKLFWKKP